ncbi:MAG: hypothetical protein GC149_10690 [Gammaproteobacteria bacterium]|nr:hypothetical protein [Gammaproteobacteria bacterium]
MKQFLLSFGLLSSSIWLTACHDKPAQTASAPNTESMQQLSTAYPGKPEAPVRIEYQLAKDIQPGVPIDISLSLTPAVDTQSMTLRYALEGALESGDPQTEFAFGALHAGAQVQQHITVIPQAEGRFRVIVSVQIDNPTGHGGSRSISIPIVVGNPPAATLKPEGKPSTDTKGAPIIETPAKEEIIRH